MFRLSLIAAAIAFAAPSFGAQVAELLASNRAGGDRFGLAVAIDGNWAVVGSTQSDRTFTNSGSAYVFFYNGSSWNQVQELVAGDPAASDEFGSSVAIDGTTIVIGSHFDDTAPMSNHGSVYVFQYNGSTWVQVRKITASDRAADDQFGYSVGVSGRTIVVGSPFDDDSFAQSGSAYIYQDTSGPGDWSSVGAEIKLHHTSPAASDQFGEAVAIDGGIIAVGCRLDDDAGSSSGSAFAFRDTSGPGNWSTVSATKLVAAPPDASGGDNFGCSVDVSGTTIIVGARFDASPLSAAGRAFVYNFNGSTWNQVQALTASDALANDNFGADVAIKGNVIVVGAPANVAGHPGATYMYRYNGSSWAQQVKMTASDGASADIYGGRSVNLAGDAVDVSGDTVLTGAYLHTHASIQSGSAYVNLEVPTPSPSPTPSASPSPSPSPSPTPSASASPTESPSASPTPSASASPTESASPSPSASASPTPSASASPTESASPSPTPSASASPTPSASASPTPSASESPTPSASASPTASPTPSPTASASASPSPTASPSASRTPSPTPQNNLVAGYFPANDQGNGLAYYYDPTPFPTIRSYRVFLRRVGQGFPFQTVIVNLPSGPGAVESGNGIFQLPLDSILVPTSFEIDIFFRAQAFTQLNAAGPILYQTVETQAKHPSADLQMPQLPDVNLPFNPPVVGTNNFIMNDDRPTAQASDYDYAIIRKLGSGPQAFLNNIQHSFTGSGPVDDPHPPDSVNTTVTAVSGNQLFFLRPQRTFKNSAGAVLGKYDLAHKSPNIYADVP